MTSVCIFVPPAPTKREKKGEKEISYCHQLFSTTWRNLCICAKRERERGRANESGWAGSGAAPSHLENTNQVLQLLPPLLPARLPHACGRESLHRCSDGSLRQWAAAMCLHWLTHRRGGSRSDGRTIGSPVQQQLLVLSRGAFPAFLSGNSELTAIPDGRTRLGRLVREGRIYRTDQRHPSAEPAR